VLTFAMLLAVTAFVVFAIVPALHASRIDTAALASASRAVVGERSRLREAAVVAQVALTVVLLAAGSVFTAAVREFRAVAVGYDVDRLVAAQLSPLPGGYEAGFSPDAYYASLLERVRALPGVEAATLANTFPLTPYSASIRVGIAGDQTEVDAEEAFVRPDFFSTMGIALAAGATFPTASGIAERSAVISEATAKALFERADVVGRAIRVGPSPQTQAIRVSGVVRDAILTNLQRANTRLVYLNQSQFGPTVQEWPALIVRSPAARPVGFAALQFAVRQGAREYVNHIRTISDQRDAALSQEQLLASVSSACAAIGLLLVVVGVFGLLSYAVTQRRREIGIRVALGARGRQVCWLVVRRALNWFVIGAAVGLPIAISGGRYAATALFGRAIDTSQTIVTIVVALGMSVVAAVLIPALRAASVDPVEMLRGDN
jgi:predicted permease